MLHTENVLMQKLRICNDTTENYRIYADVIVNKSTEITPRNQHGQISNGKVAIAEDVIATFSRYNSLEINFYTEEQSIQAETLTKVQNFINETEEYINAS